MDAPAGELFGRLVEQRRLLSGHGRPHVCLHEAGANAVHPDPVSGVGQRQALGHADHYRLAGVVGQVSPASNLAGHRCQTMTPRFCAIIVGSTAWVAKNTALALIFMIASQCSSVTSSGSAARWIPALLIR